jgi:hypothetical protein
MANQNPLVPASRMATECESRISHSVGFPLGPFGARLNAVQFQAVIITTFRGAWYSDLPCPAAIRAPDQNALLLQVASDGRRSYFGSGDRAEKIGPYGKQSRPVRMRRQQHTCALCQIGIDRVDLSVRSQRGKPPFGVESRPSLEHSGQPR